jgi:hypothetical protein
LLRLEPGGSRNDDGHDHHDEPATASGPNLRLDGCITCSALAQGHDRSRRLHVRINLQVRIQQRAGSNNSRVPCPRPAVGTHRLYGKRASPSWRRSGSRALCSRSLVGRRAAAIGVGGPQLQSTQTDDGPRRVGCLPPPPPDLPP